MLPFISWGKFLTALSLSTLFYYLTIAVTCFRKTIVQWMRKRSILLLPALLCCALAHAQTADGINGISQANSMIRSYFEIGVQLMYAISAIIALYGAVRVFKHWNAGHEQEAYRAAAGWFGSCIFIVLVAMVVKNFFGL